MDKGLSETRTILQTLRYECLGLPYSFFRVASNKCLKNSSNIAFRVAL